jgi:GTP cyclohydrolase I
MVLLKNIEFYSTCEHHMFPFYGKAHIAYIPNGKVIGVSKLARLLDIYAARLQIQERLCQQVTKALEAHLAPLGAACILEAQHMCMTARGVRKQDSIMVTTSLTGSFRTNAACRAEFFSSVKS